MIIVSLIKYGKNEVEIVKSINGYLFSKLNFILPYMHVTTNRNTKIYLLYTNTASNYIQL